MTKEVYNAKEHQRANEALHKADLKEENKPTKAKKKPEKKEAEPVTEFPCKLNRYGFIGIRKKARAFLPFNAEEPLKATIEGDALVIRKAT